jgi:hypothetical protein
MIGKVAQFNRAAVRALHCQRLSKIAYTYLEIQGIMLSTVFQGELANALFASDAFTGLWLLISDTGHSQYLLRVG